VDYFLTTADQLEGVKRLKDNRDEKYLGHKDVHSAHRPLVLIITQQWQPPLVQQKVIKHLPCFKYDTAKTAEFNKSVQHNIGVWASQAQMYLMHLTYKQQSICYNSASHNLQKKCLEIDKWP